MEKHRTIEHLLNEKIYRITKAQITKLIKTILEERKQETQKGISGVLSKTGDFTPLLGIFKGNFDSTEGGENRKNYAIETCAKFGIVTNN